MSSEEDLELDALLVEAGQVSEDFLELGLVGEEVGHEAPQGDVEGQQLAIVAEEGLLGGTAASLGKKYKVKLVDEGVDVCLKYIGSGASFCLRKQCSTNHGGAGGGGHQSFSIPQGGVLAILKSPYVAFSSPTLKLSSVEEEVVEMWDGQSYSFEDWQQLFVASNQGDGIAMSAQDIKQEVIASRNPASSFRTPAKKKRVIISEPVTSFAGYSSTFESSQERSAYKKSATSASLADSVVELDRSLSTLSKDVGKMLVSSGATVSEVEATADMSYRKAIGLENLVGSSDVMDESEYACPTVWGSLATIGEELTALRSLKAPPAPAVVDLKPLKLEIKSVQSTLESSVTKLSNFTKTFAKSILQRAIGLEDELKRQAKARLTTKQPSDDFAALLSAAVGGAAPPSGALPSAASQDRRIVELEEKLVQVLESNEKLELRFAQIIAETEADAVKFAGMGVRSVDEVGAWVSTNFPKRGYGLIMDAYLLFDLIADDGPTNQKDQLTEMKRRQELDIATEAEGQALTAFLCEIPRIFHTSSGTLVLASENISHFSRVPTYKAWNSQGGLKKVIEKKLAKLKVSLREVISNELTCGTLAYFVAVEALEKSISWVNAFSIYLETTYEHLHYEVGFNTARAWSLTTQLGARIFSELHSVRVGTLKVIGKGPDSICPVILWAVFRTHDKMAGFENANFEDHPSIASEFIKFLATNTGIEGMATIQEDLVALKLKCKEMDKQVTVATIKADKASSIADVAKKSSDSFAKKISSLESKVG